MLRGRPPLRVLLRLPRFAMGGRVARGRIAEDVGMAADHLVGDGGGHVREGEGACLLRHAGKIDDLEQQVAQFVAQGGQVATDGGIGHLVGFLDRVGGDGGEILHHVPGAAAIGRAQAGHDGEQAGEFGAGVWHEEEVVLF